VQRWCTHAGDECGGTPIDAFRIVFAGQNEVTGCASIDITVGATAAFYWATPATAADCIAEDLLGENQNFAGAVFEWAQYGPESDGDPCPPEVTENTITLECDGVCVVSSVDPEVSYLAFVNVVSTLEDQITCEEVRDLALDELPDFPDTWDGNAGSFFECDFAQVLDRTAQIATIRRARYRFRFPAPLVGGGTCYKVEWVERFTPDDEEAEIADTPRCAIWDGIIPTGYDREDPETWPILSDGINPYFELNEPEEPGEITLAEITFTCFGCGEGCP